METTHVMEMSFFAEPCLEWLEKEAEAFWLILFLSGREEGFHWYAVPSGWNNWYLLRNFPPLFYIWNAIMIR